MVTPTKQTKEHPLANILINVIVPVLILSYLSKDPDLQARLGKIAKPWHIGPLKAMILALVLPFGYGVWHYLKTRKGNFFSALGLISVLLSGGLTLYLWNQNGTVKSNAGFLTAWLPRAPLRTSTCAASCLPMVSKVARVSEGISLSLASAVR